MQEHTHGLYVRSAPLHTCRSGVLGNLRTIPGGHLERAINRIWKIIILSKSNTDLLRKPENSRMGGALKEEYLELCSWLILIGCAQNLLILCSIFLLRFSFYLSMIVLKFRTGEVVHACNFSTQRARLLWIEASQDYVVRTHHKNMKEKNKKAYSTKKEK